MSIHFITSPKHSPTRSIKQWWVIRHHCWGYPTGWRIQPVGGSNQGNWENRGAASPWSMGIGRKRTWEWGFSRAWGGGVMGKSPKCTPWITIVVPLMIHYEIWESTCSYPRSLPNVDAEANVAFFKWSNLLHVPPHRSNVYRYWNKNPDNIQMQKYTLHNIYRDIYKHS